MKTSLKMIAVLAFVSLGACANGPQHSTSATFEKFQSDIKAQRDSGKITLVQAQVDLWSKYRELFGEDPTMNGFYAFSVKIASAADSGKLSQDDARNIIDTRERELSEHRRMAEAKHDSFFYPYGIPPNQ